MEFALRLVEQIQRLLRMQPLNDGIVKTVVQVFKVACDSLWALNTLVVSVGRPLPGGGPRPGAGGPADHRVGGGICEFARHQRVRTDLTRRGNNS